LITSGKVIDTVIGTYVFDRT